MPHHIHGSSPKKRKAQNQTPPSSTILKKKSRILPDSDVDSEGEFHVVKASLRLSIPPIFANNPRAGVEEMLDSMIMRYIHPLGGVVLSHSELFFTNNRAMVKADCPFLVCDVRFDATVWSPRVGMKLVGRVNLCSPDHVSLLIHRTFNASIPRYHIPGDEWVFQYGPGENGPELGPDAAMEKEDAGRWISRRDGQRLGGELGDLEFTVTGLTIANEMLSIQGSIQLDPFSSRHAAQAGSARPAAETMEEDETIKRKKKARK